MTSDALFRDVKRRMIESNSPTAESQFENLVALHYVELYRFAIGLTLSETDACDLTQQTFYIWAQKGWQSRDASKVKTWLMTTLHREFLTGVRKRTRFPHYEIGLVERELADADSADMTWMDGPEVLRALANVDLIFRAPVTLFYLEGLRYKEIAEILKTPLGTVKSRIARGIAQLRVVLQAGLFAPNSERVGSALCAGVRNSAGLA
jgi:RNA polymerase sigma-70 factor (ECF subfamily)